FKVMERRLMKAIATPAMAATWVFGLTLLFMGGWLTSGSYWIHAKLLLVVILTGFDGMCRRWMRAFAEDTNTRPARFYRIANEVPTLLLVLIVILAIVKPF
ncbi:MAG: CopD family protein, partial [Flavobacteriaceae bacterium]